MGVLDKLYEENDFDIVDEFLDHFSLMSDSMEIIIMDLDNPEMYRRSLDELFRIFHNIKSASGFLKIEQMHRLSTFVEEVLEELRNINDVVNEEVITWLFHISDMFTAWGNDLEHDYDLTHIKYLLLKTPDLDKRY